MKTWLHRMIFGPSRRWSRTLVYALTVSFALTSPRLQAQVSASLVASDTSVQPGRPIVVALRLEHALGWHTYWVNPGIGEATSIDWNLPPGWTASEIEWPTPGLIPNEEGKIVGYGYDGVVCLPVVLTPPANARSGENITLAANVTWLMCHKQCVPGKASLSLALPISTSTPAANASVRAELASMTMPQSPGGRDFTATRASYLITLTIEGNGTEFKSPYFFSSTPLIAFDGTQAVKTSANKLTLTLPVDSYFEGDASRLVGLFAYTGARGRREGIKIDIPICEGPQRRTEPTQRQSERKRSTPASRLTAQKQTQSSDVNGHEAMIVLVAAHRNAPIEIRRQTARPVLREPSVNPPPLPVVTREPA